MIQWFVSHFPKKQNVVNLFATAAFLVYGWTIYASFWKIPAWMFYLRVSEIISAYAYSFVVNFAESLFLTLGLVFVGLFLSGNLWKDGFLPASVTVLVISVGSALLHMRIYENPNLRVDFIDSQLQWWLVTLLIAFIASFFSVRIPWLRTMLENLADRFSVFLYIYVPLTVLSLGIIIVRIAF